MGPDASLDHVTPYDRLALSDVQVEHLLATGEHAAELSSYFGAAEHARLTELARAAREKPLPADAPRVILVPGIMGSNLGARRTPPLPNDILWLDPVDIEMGHLERLKLPSNAPIVSLGIVLYSYLRLKLHLRIAGFAPVFHDYDWRLGVDELGRGLAARVEAEQSSRLMIVAHSMGGLVTRAAMRAPSCAKVERVVLLGTPNLGSFAPVQALRGTYAVVRKIARLAETQSAEMLAAEVFKTFPALYHLLPLPEASPKLDFFEPSSWPASGPQPDVALLAHARTLVRSFVPADKRFAVIVGDGQETVTRVTRHKEEFQYTITRNGDGTVPTKCAVLPGASNYFTSVAHSELARDEVVSRAITELLRTGQTKLLKSKVARTSAAEARITDSELRGTHTEKVDWAKLEPDARRIFLQTLNEPPRLKLRLPAAAKRNALAPRGRKAAARNGSKRATGARSAASTLRTRKPSVRSRRGAARKAKPVATGRAATRKGPPRKGAPRRGK